MMLSKKFRAMAFALNVAVPLLILTIAMIKWGLSLGLSELAETLLMIWIVLGAIPVTAVYWGILFLEFSPRGGRELAWLMLPFFTSLFFAAITGRASGFLNGLIIEASAIYTGLTICFLAGIGHIFVGKLKEKWPSIWKDCAIFVVFMGVFLALFGGPAYLFARMGFDLADGSIPYAGAFYALQIACLVAGFYPQLVKLYWSGKL